MKTVLAKIKDVDNYLNCFNIPDTMKKFRILGKKCVRCGIEGNTIELFCQEDKRICTSFYHESEKSTIIMTVDHILPVSKGGAKKSLENKQIMCEDCNTKKGNMLTWYEIVELIKLKIYSFLGKRKNKNGKNI